jgi:catechol 2,3-dioxygenase-like lactoylglutathione lyase family enzyme
MTVTPRLQGLHHVAYTTRDPEATYDFYVNGLGMTLLRTENHRSGDGYFKHFFFGMGAGEALAFFFVDEVGEKPDYRTDISTGLGLPPWANHVAFRFDTLDELEAMTTKLHAFGIDAITEIDHGWCTSIYALDPNGIMIEFCVTTDAEQFGDQTPDEALRLLQLSPDEIEEATRKDDSISASI